MLQSRQVIAFARALLRSALLGCGSPEEATPTAEPAATPTSLAAPEAAAENADAPALPATPPAAADGPAPVLEIGYTEVPAQPSTAQMRLNRPALAAHRVCWSSRPLDAGCMHLQPIGFGQKNMLRFLAAVKSTRRLRPRFGCCIVSDRELVGQMFSLCFYPWGLLRQML